MINVLYTVPDGVMGGVERFLDSVFRKHTGVRPVVLAFSEGAWLEDLRSRGVASYCLPGRRLREPLRCFQEVKALLERERIDIVHSSYAWCHAMVAPAAIWQGCKLIWFHQGPLSGNRWQGFTQLVPAHLVLANSEFTRDRLSRTFRLAKATRVVHLGLDHAQFTRNPHLGRKFRRAFGFQNDTLLVGIVGFIDVWKGQDVFLQAAKLLASDSSNIRLLVIGGPRTGVVAERCQKLEKELHKFVSDNGLHDLVTFTGHLDVKDGVLDALDIFVHASTEPEPFGMAILEAMANGKAVIASDEGGPREIITNCLDGLLIRPREPLELALAIRRLVGDSELRGALSTAAVITVATKFNAQTSAEKLEQLYNELLKIA
jgi:glycosyltransferase involved in cell wall biosynthesis